MSNNKKNQLTEAERNSWTKAYRFFETWNHVHSEADWLAMANAFGSMNKEDQQDELFQRLIACSMDYWNDRQLKQEQEAREAPEQTVLTDASGKPVNY